jgi:aryl-alcohol dehydrogenase-like predicted oxidoreductase
MGFNPKRRIILASALSAAGSIVGHRWFTQKSAPPATAISMPPGKIPERILGKTGVSVPLLGLGGAGQTPLSQANAEAEAIELLEQAYKLGIRYFDTAASYGPSEDFLGKVLPPFRQEIFLTSKTTQRDRDGAWRELERSLKRLQTDHLDLWQMHSVSFSEELDQILGKNGAIQAVEEAKQQKLIRFVGITGHHEPAAIAEGLERYPFDTTLIPINAADKHHPRPFIPEVLPIAQQRQVGVIAMKVPAYGRLLKPGVLQGMSEAMGYALSQLGVHCCIIAAENAAQLASNIQVAQTLKALTAAELQAIEQKTAQAWEDNTFFRAWT